VTGFALTRVTFAQLVVALAKDDFELRLTETGALMIFDLRYEKGGQLRAPPPGFVKLVFDNAEKIGGWLEEAHDPDP
jgi:hypothetical protein